jgi:DNA-binding transcriptional MerR regulator
MMTGEVSKLTHTKVATIRFYEQIGLLVGAPRTDSGRRTYRTPTCVV